MIRADKMEQALAGEGIDAVVATTPENVFYASGFSGPLSPHRFCVWSAEEGGPYLVLPNGDTDLLVTNGLQFEEVYSYGDYYYYRGDNLSEREEHILELNFHNNSPSAIEALLDALSGLVGDGDTLALETKNLTAAEAREIEAGTGCDIVPGEGVFSDLRRIKSPEEVRRLERSVSITQAAIDYSVRQVEPGMTEQDLEKIYKKRLLDLGGEPGFCLIGFGRHSAESCIPGERALREGDVILYDAGCTYQGYSSDIARTFAFREADPVIEQKYEVLNAGMDHEFSLLRDSADTADVFEQTMAFIRAEGADQGIDDLADFRRHHLGHGIGISTYDDPVITAESATIEAGMVMCLEPPYYEIGTAGIQVEDEVLVTEEGAKRLSRCPDELIVVG